MKLCVWVPVCVCVSDGSPSSSPIDHRRVQADLAEVMVYLHPPEILTPTSIRITWTVRTWPYHLSTTLIFSLPNLIRNNN